MRKIALSLAILATTLIPVLCTATELNNRTWVSNIGVDPPGNTQCSVTAPCLTFAGAISETNTGGEINCLTPGGFGGVNITKSITIDCYGVLAGVVPNSGANGFIINAPGGTVTLRYLVIDGIAGGTNGIDITNAAAVTLTDLTIFNFSGKGIYDQRATAGGMGVINAYITGNGGAGIVIAGAAGTNAQITNVVSAGNTYGVAVASGNGVNVTNSFMEVNSVAGVEADGGASGVLVDGTSVSGNGTGVAAHGPVTLNNSTITGNTTVGISGSMATSFGNNRILNTNNGTTPTLIGLQ
ncbi:MAG: right-handed parallel beta-helix repeat-containing protein [Xanthobacteraceae bacterium]|jgi:hypothetical protein